MASVTPVTDVHEWLEERQVMIDLLKQHLSRAQHRMKVQADRKRSDRIFSVGDQVFLKLQPYVQTSVARRANHKLSFKFFGPYSVLAKIGAVAYKLNLPEDSKIHPVFHVSQLKPARQRQDQITNPLPAPTSALQVPLAIQDYRWHKGTNKMIKQGYVLWSHASPEASTWEDLEDLQRRFPAAPAWVPVKILESRWYQPKHSPDPPVKQVRVEWNYSVPEKATWEDFELLRHRFPDAAACGQAVSQGEGIVSNLPTTPPGEGPEEQPKLHRHRRPNTHYIGPDWVGPKLAQQARPRAPGITGGHAK